MNIEEYADVIGKEIHITRYPNQDNRYMARFEAEIKGDGVLIGKYGNGRTPTEAINSYVKKIKGQILVFNSYTDRRVELKVPNYLETI